jgi:hypothetical protein
MAQMRGRLNVGKVVKIPESIDLDKIQTDKKYLDAVLQQLMDATVEIAKVGMFVQDVRRWAKHVEPATPSKPDPLTDEQFTLGPPSELERKLYEKINGKPHPRATKDNGTGLS